MSISSNSEPRDSISLVDCSEDSFFSRPSKAQDLVAFEGFGKILGLDYREERGSIPIGAGRFSSLPADQGTEAGASSDPPQSLVIEKDGVSAFWNCSGCFTKPQQQKCCLF